MKHWHCRPVTGVTSKTLPLQQPVVARSHHHLLLRVSASATLLLIEAKNNNLASSSEMWLDVGFNHGDTLSFALTRFYHEARCE